jgi:hypothetical protein
VKKAYHTHSELKLVDKDDKGQMSKKVFTNIDILRLWKKKEEKEWGKIHTI